MVRRFLFTLAVSTGLVLAFDAGTPLPAIAQLSQTAPPRTTSPVMPVTNAEKSRDAIASDIHEPDRPSASMLGFLSDDLSPWGMFLHADIVVKIVICGLILASVVTWTIWLAKTLELMVARRRLRRAYRVLREARSLTGAAEGLAPNDRVARALVWEASEEWRRSAAALDDRDGLKERIALHLQRTEAMTGRRMMVGTGLLATIGSTSPFVGLFGTVWGIMNSFIGISKLHTTNLAVVAPGVAEALLATACGLIAAIPAVVIYNHFARQIATYKALLANAASTVMALASRDLSHGDPTATEIRQPPEPNIPAGKPDGKKPLRAVE